MYAVRQRTTAINTALMHYIISLAQTTRSLVVRVEIRVVLTRCQLLSFAPFWSYLEVKYSILMCAEGKRQIQRGGKEQEETSLTVLKNSSLRQVLRKAGSF